MDLDFSNRALKAGTLAPLFTFLGAPLIGQDGKQICASFTHAARKLFEHLVAKEIVSPDAAPDDVCRLTTLDLIAQDALPFIWQPTDIFIISRDGYCLVFQRSHVGTAPGKLLHSAGGFPKVIDGRAEIPQATALREGYEETGLIMDKCQDTGLQVLDNTLQPYTLAQTISEEKVPGVVAIRLGLKYHFSLYSLAELVEMAKPNGEHVGMVPLTPDTLEAICSGRECHAPYFYNNAEFAQRFVCEYEAHRPTFHLSDLTNKLAQGPRLSGAEKLQQGSLIKGTETIISKSDFSYGRVSYTPAAIAQAFMCAGFEIGPRAQAEIEKFIIANAVPENSGMRKVHTLSASPPI